MADQTKTETPKKKAPRRKKKAPVKKAKKNDPPTNKKGQPISDKPPEEKVLTEEQEIQKFDGELQRAELVVAIADGIGRGIAEAIKGTGCMIKIRAIGPEATVEVAPLGMSIPGETQNAASKKADVAKRKAAKEARRLTALAGLPYKVADLKKMKRRELLVLGAAIGIKDIIKAGASEKVVAKIQAECKKLGAPKLKELAAEAKESLENAVTDTE